MMLDASPVFEGKHGSQWSESVLKYKISTMTESRLPRNGAMLTLVIDVLQIGHGSLSPFEGTVSPGRRSDIEESLLDLDPMGR
jgi:hypothetical protein